MWDELAERIRSWLIVVGGEDIVRRILRQISFPGRFLSNTKKTAVGLVSPTWSSISAQSCEGLSLSRLEPSFRMMIKSAPHPAPRI